jgi:RNA methyltransferase, TrmH family
MRRVPLIPGIVVTSRHNPLVKRFRDVARSRRPGQRTLLLEGSHLVGEALDAGVRVVCAAFSESALSDAEHAEVARRLAAAAVDVVTVSDAVLSALSPVGSPSGVVAIGEHEPASLEAAFEEAPQLVFIAVDLQDPGNAGALVRSAEAAGATAVVFCGASADPLGWKALRGSMGSALRLPVVAPSEPGLAIEAARRRGVRVIATAPRGGGALYGTDLTEPIAVLLGGEGPGLVPSLLAQCDAVVSIPMRAPVESLNVAVAAAVVGYEAFRQRGFRSDPRPGRRSSGRERAPGLRERIPPHALGPRDPTGETR